MHVKFNKSSKFCGFTLIELLVTITIVAIIAAVSIPSYTKYRLRAKVAQLITSVTAAKLAVQNDYFNQGYTLTKSDYISGSQIFVTPTSSIINSIEITDGIITLNANADDFGGRNITLRFNPTVTNNDITWTCYTESQYFDLMPPDCQNAL